jgi:ATP-dependent DNA ligase
MAAKKSSKGKKSGGKKTTKKAAKPKAAEKPKTAKPKKTTKKGAKKSSAKGRKKVAPGSDEAMLEELSEFIAEETTSEEPTAGAAAVAKPRPSHGAEGFEEFIERATEDAPRREKPEPEPEAPSEAEGEAKMGGARLLAEAMEDPSRVKTRKAKDRPTQKAALSLCPYCGAFIGEDAEVCSYCNSPLTEDA